MTLAPKSAGGSSIASLYTGGSLCAKGSSDERESLRILTPRPVFEARKYRPAPVRREFENPITLNGLDKIDYGSGKHFIPRCVSDKVAFGLVKFFRVFADTYFQKRYMDRVTVIETVAAVPGLVGGMFKHLYSLRTLEDNGDVIQKLLREAENERQHLLTFIELNKPGILDKLLIRVGQAFFFQLLSCFLLSFSKNSTQVRRLSGGRGHPILRLLCR